MSAELTLALPLPSPEPPALAQYEGEQHSSHLLHKLGELATNTVAFVQEGVDSIAIHTQMKVWNAIEAAGDVVTGTKDYLKQKGGKATSHVLLAGLALGGSVGFMSFEGVGTAYAESNTIATVAHHIANGNWGLHPNSPTIASAISETMTQGAEFDVQCVAVGDPINPSGQEVATTDPNADVAWEYGTDPTDGDTGYVSDQGVDTAVTPGQEIEQLAAQGIPECGSGTTPDQTASTQPITSVFFSPIPNQPNGLALLPDVANVDYAFDDWTIKNSDCSDAQAVRDIENLPSTVDTLAGWSLARLGPIYFLAGATQEQKDRIHTIILFDPGNTKDFVEGCDTNKKYNINTLLAEWLRSNKTNRLIIYTGLRTEEGSAGPYPQPFQEQLQNGTFQQQPYIDNETFAGLWKYYLAGIWSKNFANQAQICDYNGMSHEDVLRNFAHTVQNPQSGCPVAADGQEPVAWNP